MEETGEEMLEPVGRALHAAEAGETVYVELGQDGPLGRLLDEIAALPEVE